MRRLHRKNRGAHLGGLPGFHSEYNVLEQPNKIMYFHWSEAHCGLVVVKPQKCEILIKKKYRKSSEILRFRNFSGGDKRDRTADLLNAIQALSQTHRLHTPVTGSVRCASIRNTTINSHKTWPCNSFNSEVHMIYKIGNHGCPRRTSIRFTSSFIQWP